MNLLRRKGYRSLLYVSTFLSVAFFLFLGSESAVVALATLGERIMGQHLSIGTASGSLYTRITLKNIEYTQEGTIVHIDQMALHWHPLALLTKKVHIQRIDISGLKIRTTPTNPPQTTPEPFTSFRLPLTLQVDGVFLRHFRLQAHQSSPFTIQSAGITNLHFQKTVLQFTKLFMLADNIQLRGQGQVQTTANFPLELQAEYSYQDPTLKRFSGNAVATGSLQNLQIHSELTSPWSLHLSGRLHELLTLPAWDLHLNADDILLSDLTKAWPQYRFTQLACTSKGNLEGYNFSLHTQAKPPLTSSTIAMKLTGTGDAQGITLQSAIAEGKSRLALSGFFKWQPVLSWSSTATLTALNPAVLFPQWPGELSGSIQSTGTQTEAGLSASLHIQTIGGLLRQYPIHASADIQTHNTDTHIQHLLLRSGSSLLQGHGTLGKKSNFSWTLSSEHLQEVWPQAKGALQARGKMTGPIQSPSVALHLHGAKLHFGDSSLQHLTLSLNGALTPPYQLNGELKAGSLQAGTSTVASINALVEGSLQKHHVTFNAIGPDFTTALTLNGIWTKNLWQGTIDSTDINLKSYGHWQQKTAATINLSPKQYSLSSYCLQGEATRNVCVAGTWQPQTQSWNAESTLSQFPLAFLPQIDSTTLAGQLNVQASAQGHNGTIHQGALQGNLDHVRLTITQPNLPPQMLIWQENNFSVALEAQRLTAHLRSVLHNTSSIEATAAIDRFSLEPGQLTNAQLQANTQITIKNLNKFNALSQQKVQLSGGLEGHFSAKGPLLSPVVTGKAAIKEGQVTVPDLGITLSPVTLDLAGDSKTLTATAVTGSGDGELHLMANLYFDILHEKQLEIALQGDHFTGANLPEMQVILSPDLHFIRNKEKMELTGKVEIPSANITSVNVGSSVSPSDDVIILDDNQTAQPTVTAPPFSSHLTLILGPDVTIDAYGLKSGISGKLTLVNQPNRPITGNGTLSLQKASMTLYGRRLHIDTGRLFFTGGPLDNPGIELRSERKKKNVTVGVVAGGVLQRPKISFYSTPAMDQLKIVSNLLESTAIGGETRKDVGFIGDLAEKTGFGKVVPYLEDLKSFSMIDEIRLDTDYETDSVSLVLGTWLTPDFYISYGKNLNDQAGSLTTRYTIGKGFYFETDSDATQSGGDLKYEFER